RRFRTRTASSPGERSETGGPHTPHPPKTSDPNVFATSRAAADLWDPVFPPPPRGGRTLCGGAAKGGARPCAHLRTPATPAPRPPPPPKTSAPNVFATSRAAADLWDPVFPPPPRGGRTLCGGAAKGGARPCAHIRTPATPAPRPRPGR